MTSPFIRQVAVGVYKVNTYLVACRQTGQAVIIDPGGEAKKILEKVRQEKMTPIYILNTHGHGDHVLANHKLQKDLNVPVAMHEADDIFFSDPAIREISRKELGLPPAGPADIKLQDNDILQVGNLEIRIIHTPGHTPGSACFLVDGNLFTGDTLFVGDVGRSDLTGGSFEQLLASLKNKVIILPGETTVWPGHDYGETPTSTLDWEMRENPYITDFILAE